MRVADFDFPLPRALIAAHPAEPRDAARLLVVGGKLADRRMTDLPQLLRRGDVLVVNDTRVIPARLYGKRGKAAIEATLHRAEGPGRWRAFVKGAKRLKQGDVISFAADFSANVAEKFSEGDVSLEFSRQGEDLQTRARNLWRHAAAALYQAQDRRRCPRPRRLPDHFRPPRRRGGRAHRRAAFHARPAPALDRAGIGARIRDLACRRGYVSAGESGRHQGPSHAQRDRFRFGRGGVAHQRGAPGGRKGRRGRHHQPAPLGKRRRRKRPDRAFRGRNRRCSSPRAIASARSICC